jgi:oligopeptide transport system substrate-binding protein
VRFVIFPGNVVGDMMHAFERGDLEESPIPPGRQKELIESKKYVVIRKPTLSLLLMGFNLEHPPFDQLGVRQALNYAIDKVRINREIRADRFVVARGILPPGMPGYNPEVEGYGYNLDKAKALLAEAGYPDGKNLPPIVWASSVKSAVSRQDYEAVQQYLADIGVQLELREFDNWPAFQQALQRGELEMFRYAWFADYPDPDNFLYPLFHSRSADNYFRYRNPRVDRLLDEGRRETNDLQRVKLYREAEQLIMNDAPAIMLLHFTYEGLFQPYVDGIEVSALGDPYIPMGRIRIDQTRQANVKE